MTLRHRTRILTTASLLLLVFLTSRIDAGELGPSAGAFLRIGVGADHVGMGDCGVALVGSGMNWYYNPAALPFQEARQASIGYRNMSLDRSMMYAEYSMPFKPNAGLAVGFLRAGTGNIDARDSNGRPLDKLSHSENLIHGSFAITPHRQVAVGISIKWLINAVPDVIDDNSNLYAYAMGIDLGVQVAATPGLRFGLQLRDLNASYVWETSDVWGDQSSTKEDKLPSLVRLGAAFDPIDGLTLAADAVMHPDQLGDDAEGLEPHFGAEYRRGISTGRAIALRAGWNGKAPTFGLGLTMKLGSVQARMDYAFLVEQVSPGGSHLIGWVIKI